MDVLQEQLYLWIVIFIFTLVFFAYYYYYHYAGTPPGPWGLPVFGYLPFLSRTPYTDFTEIAKKYGDIFSVRIGTRFVIVFNDYQSIKETSMKEIFSGKPVDATTAEFGDFKSAFVTDGEIWRDQRRFLLSTMRDFGFGKQQMEEKICEEAKLLIEEFSKTKDQSMEIRDTVYVAIANIISCLIFAHKFRYDDENVIHNLKVISEAISALSHFTILDAIPILEHILPLSLLGVKKFAEIKRELYSFIDVEIEEHKKTFDSNNIRDVLDVYILKQKNMKEKKQSLKTNIFSDDYIRANIVMLFAAGTETTALTIIWSLKLLALNSKVQARVQQEIDSVIGSERLPKMSDRRKMPFTEATLLELERVITLLPLTYYHRMTENTTYKGYKIPKNSFILYNLWNVHNDSKVWENPSSFNPDRFLENNGKVSKLHDYVIPFSIGKRNCLGESLASMELFLILTSLLQKLTFQLKEDTSLDTTNEIPIRIPKSSRLYIIPRN